MDQHHTNRLIDHMNGRAREPRPRCCLHIGLPKTATTMLQNYLFARHSQVEYLGSYHTREKRQYLQCRDADVARLMTELLWDGKARPDFRRCHELYQRSIAPSLAAGRVPVWSWESLSLSGLKTRRRRAENLFAVFGPCRVLVSIREPLRLVESVYFQMIKRENTGVLARRGVGVKLPPLDQWLRDSFQTGEGAPVAHLEYAQTIKAYADVFGKDSVRVMLFEQLVEDAEAFIDALCRFIGIDAAESLRLTSRQKDNVRWNYRQIDALRHFERSWWASLRFRMASRRERERMLGLQDADAGSSAPSARAEIPEEFKQRISEMTREGNRYLMQIWGLPLDQYNYPV